MCYKVVQTVFGTEIWNLFGSYARYSQMKTNITLLHCLVTIVISSPHFIAFLQWLHAMNTSKCSDSLYRIFTLFRSAFLLSRHPNDTSTKIRPFSGGDTWFSAAQKN